MSKACLEVHHPQPFEKVHAAERKQGKDTYYFIAACGRAHDVENLVACLVNQEDKSVYPGEVLEMEEGSKIGPYWIIGFPTLAPKLKSAGERFHLFIAEASDPKKRNVGNRAVSVEFTIFPPVRKEGSPAAKRQQAGEKPSKGREEIPIQYPLPGATVGGSFTAWGTNASSGDTTHGTMDCNGNTYNGALAVAPPGSWAIRFNNIPDGNPYTLTIDNAPQIAQGSHPNITINSPVNPPTPAPGPPPPPPGP